MNCILVPTLALDLSLLQRLHDSIDYPVENKVVINNGKPGILDEWGKRNGWKIIDQYFNIGVSGSWNLAPKIFTDDHWLILNDDQELLPGALEKICKASDENPDADIIYVNQFEGFDIFVWTRQCFTKFGGFDENFYPAYYEDFEMRLRFFIGGVKAHVIEKDFPVKHGKPHVAGPKYSEMLRRSDDFNREYFIRKWGMIGDKDPVYLTPFNSGFPLCYCPLEVSRRFELVEIFKDFINDTNPSVYL